MRLLFRTDGDTIIGGGHVMRCLTLAHEAKTRGHDVGFVMAAKPDSMSERVRTAGFRVFDLKPTSAPQLDSSDPTHSTWLATSWQEDARITGAAAKGFSPDWIIWDHYGLDARWTTEVRKTTPFAQFLTIDDLDDRPLASEFVLDQTRMSKISRTNVADAYLTGASFALLRPEFSKMRSHSLARRNAKISRVLIAPGMVDGAGLSPLALKALATFPNISIDVVMGSSSQTVAEVERLLLDRPNASLVLDANDMAARMALADLCIGAGGMTSWERCCLGLPAVAICTADNQKMALGSLEAAGALIALSLEQANDTAIFQNALRQAMVSAHKMSKAASTLCDGLGAKRVMDVLEAKLRPVTVNDAKTLFDWCNQPCIRSASLNQSELNKRSEKQRIEKIVHKGNGLWLIYSEGRHELGHVNARPSGNSRNAKIWSWGFYIGAEDAPRGAGHRMLVAFLKLLFQQPEVEALEAEVRADNARSIALHKRLGFRQMPEIDPQVLVFRLDSCDVKLAAGNLQLVRGEHSNAP